MIPAATREDFEIVRKILVQHRGKANAITQYDLAGAAGFRTGDELTNAANVRRVQLMLQHYRREFPLPVVSSGRGVFLAETAEEINEWFEAMNSRHAAETETMCAVRDVAIASGKIQVGPWKVANPPGMQMQMPLVVV